MLDRILLSLTPALICACSSLPQKRTADLVFSMEAASQEGAQAEATQILPAPKFVAEKVSTIVDDLTGGDGLLMVEGMFVVSSPKASSLTLVDMDGETSPFVESGLNQCYGISRAEDGTIFVANWGDTNIASVGLDGKVEVFLQATSKVGNVYVDSNGDVIVPYFYTGVIERVTRKGARTVIGQIPQNKGLHGILFDDQRQLYASSHLDGRIYKIAKDGSATLFAQLPGKMGNILWYHGNFFATGFDTHRIYLISRAGEVEVFAGKGEVGRTDGQALQAGFNNPNGIFGGHDGRTLYVSESGGRIRRISLKVAIAKRDSAK